ncbi:hypothetical protein H0G86_000552 [Trichoderma simmonsii]|uniref:Uncharacterized protein n=1 Tax=Trichoderma simmonsii TaxID=1491479 RepID=A0A8G0P8D4_9HYPO|nr:hypothetical protein H0G86_000552 [Trichoderma simmonsii]
MKMKIKKEARSGVFPTWVHLHGETLTSRKGSKSRVSDSSDHNGFFLCYKIRRTTDYLLSRPSSWGMEQSKGKLYLGDLGSIGYCCCCSALNFMSLFFPDDLILR